MKNFIKLFQAFVEALRSCVSNKMKEILVTNKRMRIKNILSKMVVKHFLQFSLFLFDIKWRHLFLNL